MSTNEGLTPQTWRIEGFGLSGLFEKILIKEEQKVWKLDPEIYERILSAFDAKANETWVVGDNLVVDFVVPQSVGINGVWMSQRNALPNKKDKPSLTVGSLPEIEQYVFQ